MASADSEEFTVLREDLYDDPSQLSQLLRQRAGHATSIHFTDSTAHRASANTDAAGTAQEPSVTHTPLLQLPAPRLDRDPTPRRAPQATNYARPSLPRHRTAPTASGFAMDRAAGEKMHQSFAGAIDDMPGDTQPDSQIYRNWTSGIWDSGNGGTGPASVLNPVDEEGHPSDHTDGVNMMGSSQELHSPAITSPTMILEEDPDTQFRLDPAPTSPLKFETPAMAGKKRDSQAHALSSAMRTSATPGTTLSAAFFGAGVGNGAIGHAMSLTQVFNATQAGTSPVVGAPSDDPVFQRPSPNFTHTRQSSPLQALSSPTKAGRPEPPLRSSSEPRAEYVTMKESQDRRKRELPREDTAVSAQDSWNEPTEEQKHAAIRRERERLDREVGKSYARSVTIMNSQPDEDSIPRPKPLIIPSSPSANEYSISQTVMATKTGYTSQVVSSSMPPRPPQPSSPILGDQYGEDRIEEEEDEERVPSSPPALTHEDEITYDEHSGREEDQDEQSEIASIAQGDVDMDDQGDVQDEEVEEMPETHQEDEELILFRQPEHDETDNPTQKPFARPHNQRQSTVPESDVLEDPEPPDLGANDDLHEDASAPLESIALNQTNSTDPFHTAQENQSQTQVDRNPSQGTKNGEDSSSIPAPRVRSLDDIANQPKTQVSEDIGEIEMPQLSFTEDLDDDFSEKLHRSSPVRPAKRRKVYSAKKKTTFANSIQESEPEVETRVESPSLEQVHAREETPPSAREREEEGARAAAHAHEEVVHVQAATLKSARLSHVGRRVLAKNRKGALKPVKKTRPSLAPRSESHLSEVSDQPRTLETARAPEADVEMRDANAPIEEPDSPDELADSDPPKPVGVVPTVSDIVDRGEAPAGEILTPNRVFARWPGGNQAFYPATCLGHADRRHMQIRYDDGNFYPLEPDKIRALDLRVGDFVKVDQDGVKKQIYVVVGFKDKIDIETAEEYPLTDRHGYLTVLLEAKQRESLPSTAVVSSEIIPVPLATVYLTSQLLNKFKDRTFTFTPAISPSDSASRVATPSNTTDRQGTPSKSRRGTIGPSFLKDGIHRAGSVTSSVKLGSVFTNMAFAITTTQESTDRDSIVNMITSNGGHILTDGFQELFENIDSSSSSPDQLASPLQSAKASVVSTSDSLPLDDLVIKSTYRTLGFVSLISDSHSRRTKHIQALALNLPCLHHRWLSDSTAASKPLPFAKYLLPAGVSTYLGPGIVRSRTMDLYDPAGADADFAARIASRDLLLRKQSVLLVMGRKKEDIERKKPYLFLTHALGPKTVGRVPDLGAAKTMLLGGGAKNENSWDWVYVDGGKDEVANAASVLWGDSSVVPAASTAKKEKVRKRKRDVEAEADVGAMVRGGVVGGKTVRVTSDEFVIQSLILGALVEE
ncbi:hypothetical protein BCR34DRAFT_503561 [Clohesyomyces aquaticus]|uniref:BRCT domain-containing protein n=1 Tax=Clohesyomyces aquaticus TaxID=1231657 RepID=A0A1Y2A9K3_9PLEO|nr:hypothetical protein BCR34DRAFT_503561 [Clohesyomyces aquaticus]